MLSLRELAELTEGHLDMGAMPPLGGDMEPVGRLVVDRHSIEPGDVFWSLPGTEMHVDEAFVRGALGVVVAGRRVEPWAGTFTLTVAESASALIRLGAAMRDRFVGSLVIAATPGPDSFESRSLAALARAMGHHRRTIPRNCPVQACLGLVEIPDDRDVMVFELADPDAREMFEISALCDPEIIVITCLRNSHPDLVTQPIVPSGHCDSAGVSWIVSGELLGFDQLPIPEHAVVVAANGSRERRKSTAADLSAELDPLIAINELNSRRCTALRVAWTLGRMLGVEADDVDRIMEQLHALASGTQGCRR